MSANALSFFVKQQLDFIAQGDAETTRRSGALPYAVLALVHGDMGLFDKAFLRLTSIVADSSRDSAKIHAMHSIRVMLLDARHSHLFKRYFQKSIITSLDAYETEKSVSVCKIPVRRDTDGRFLPAGASGMLHSSFPPT